VELNFSEGYVNLIIRISATPDRVSELWVKLESAAGVSPSNTQQPRTMYTCTWEKQALNATKMECVRIFAKRVPEAFSALSANSAVGIHYQQSKAGTVEACSGTSLGTLRPLAPLSAMTWRDFQIRFCCKRRLVCKTRFRLCS
jgi:hypothetical protein